MGVEVAREELRGVGLEVTPVVLVPEARRGDLRPRRDGPQVRHLLRRQRLVQRHELVDLMLTHEVSARSQGPLTAPESRTPKAAQTSSNRPP